MNTKTTTQLIEDAEIVKQLLTSSARLCSEYLHHDQLSCNLKAGAECIDKLIQALQTKKEGS